MHIKTRHRVSSTAHFSPKRSEAVGGNKNNSYNVFHDYTTLIVVSHWYYWRRFSEYYFWYVFSLFSRSMIPNWTLLT